MRRKNLLITLLCIALVVTGLPCTILAAPAGNIAINSVNFPDDSFRNYISTYIDRGRKDNKLSQAEIDDVTAMYLGSNVEDLTGISYFTNLRILDCSDSKITHLDVSALTRLVILDCSNCDLVSLVLPAGNALARVDCSRNELTSLDVSGCNTLVSCIYSYAWNYNRIIYTKYMNLILIPYFLLVDDDVIVNFAPIVTPTVTDEPSVEPSVSPTVTDEPTIAPSVSPTVTDAPTIAPSVTPTVTDEPTIAPSVTPTVTDEPTIAPSVTPTVTDEPTIEPSVSPTVTDEPTVEPSVSPTVTEEPTIEPSVSPTVTDEPTVEPSVSPTVTEEPTVEPSVSPTVTEEPTITVVVDPTTVEEPSVSPTVTEEIVTVVPTTVEDPEPTQIPIDVQVMQDFVTRCYINVLDREPEAAGFDYWVNLLVTRQLYGSQVAYGFLFSPEALSRNFSNSEFINRLYLLILDRQCSDSELAYWVNRLDAGDSREQIFAGFVNSTEYSNLCSDYGYDSGHYVPGYDMQAQGGVNDFVARLYVVALGRDGSSSERSYHIEGLVNGSFTGAAVIESFLNGPEYTSANNSNTSFIRDLYLICLNREADSTGLNDWLTRMNNGATRIEVIRGFVGSDEFATLCGNCGITIGSI